MDWLVGSFVNIRPLGRRAGELPTSGAENVSVFPVLAGSLFSGSAIPSVGVKG